jgi:hypothetical protein
VVLVGSVTGQWHTVAPTGFPAELAAAPSLTCPTAGHCLAIVGTDQVEVTADGGRTWRAGKIVAGTAASATGPPTASTVEPLSSACTASGRCLLLAARSPAAAVPPGPAQLQVLVNG